MIISSQSFHTVKLKDGFLSCSLKDTTNIKKKMSNYHNLISLKQIRKCTSKWICPLRLWIYLRNWKFIRYMVWQSDIYSLLLVCISGLECRSIQCLLQMQFNIHHLHFTFSIFWRLWKLGSSGFYFVCWIPQFQDHC